MGVAKNRGKPLKMDGENNGKPYFWMDDLGGKPTIFGVLTVLTGVISPLIISASGAHRAGWIHGLPYWTNSERGRNRSQLSTTEPSHGMILQVLIGYERFLLKSETQDDVRVVKKKVLSPNIQRVFYISGVLRSIDQLQFTGEFLILILEGKIKKKYIYIYIGFPHKYSPNNQFFLKWLNWYWLNRRKMSIPPKKASSRTAKCALKKKTTYFSNMFRWRKDFAWQGFWGTTSLVDGVWTRLPNDIVSRINHETRIWSWTNQDFMEGQPRVLLKLLI